MWDQRKLVLAGIILAAALTVAGVTFVILRANRSGLPQSQHSAGTADTSEQSSFIGTQSGQNYSSNDVSATGENVRGGSGENQNTQSSGLGSGTQNGETGVTIPTPTMVPSQASGTPTPTPAIDQLSVPGDPNFSAASFQITAQNSSAKVRDYIYLLNKSTAGFDLINGFSSIQSEISQALGDMDFQALAHLRQQAEQKQEAVANIPVPSRILGLAQNYYLAYGRLDDFLGVVSKFLSSGAGASDQMENQVQNAQDDFEAVSDILNNDYQTALQISGQ